MVGDRHISISTRPLCLAIPLMPPHSHLAPQTYIPPQTPSKQTYRPLSLKQGYSIRNPKCPLAKFPFSPGSGTVTVKIQQKRSNYAQKVMWSGLICVKGDTFFVV